jgi:hypothetical protein
MSAQPARHLHPVNSQTGEIEDPVIQGLRDEVKGLERALRKEIRAHEELRRDKEAEARDSRHWPVAVVIFKAWQAKTGHTRSAFTADRFFLVEPFLKRKEYGPVVCVRAVAGIAFDHFSAKRRNGSVRRFDEWERCFADAKQLEERASAAPRGWREDPVVAHALDKIARLTA